MDNAKLSQIVDNIISIKPMFFKAFGKPVKFNSEIAPAEYFVMLHLYEKESLTMTDIGKISCISKPNVTVLVNKLMTKGFVERLTNNQDRRIIKIRLTDEGVQFVKKNKTEFRKGISKKLLLLTEEETEQFSVSLQSVKNILTKISFSE